MEDWEQDITPVASGAADDWEKDIVPVAPKKAGPSGLRAGLIAATQGLTGDFADELGGLLGRALIGEGVKLGPGAQPAPDDSPTLRALKHAALAREAARPTTYQTMRDLLRGEDKQAQEAHPEIYLPAQIGGAVVQSMVPGLGLAKGANLAATTGKMALLGGATGLGASDADVSQGDAQNIGRAALDTSLGIGLGGAAGAAAHGLEKGIGAVANKVVDMGDTRLGRAIAKAREMGGKKVAEGIGTDKSAAGRASTAAYKNVRNIIDAGAEDLITDPVERATFDRLKAEMGESGLKGLLPDAAAKDAAMAAFKESVANQEGAAAAHAAELLKPTRAADARSLMKSHGEQLIGMTLGGYGGRKLDNALDTDGLFTAAGTGAGYFTGRTRGAKKLLDLLRKPSNQESFARTLRGIGEKLGVEEGAGRAARAVGRAVVPKISAREALLGIPGVAGLLDEDAEPETVASTRRRY